MATARRRPRIFGCWGWRYEDQHTRDGLIENLSWCDEIAEVDDRARTDSLWVHEATYRKMQRQALIDAGIKPWDWCYISSPDERISDNAKLIIPALIRQRRRVAFSLPLREMWTPTAYRCDGFWNRKTRPRLYPFLPGQEFTRRRIQSTPIPVSGLRTVACRKVQIYHLESIEPASRVERAIVYKALDMDQKLQNPKDPRWLKLDPENRYFRRYGYFYLCDDRTPPLRLQKIARPQGFTPAYDPAKPFLFRVPDELLVKECGRTRAQLLAELERTLGYLPPGAERGR